MSIYTCSTCSAREKDEKEQNKESRKVEKFDSHLVSSAESRYFEYCSSIGHEELSCNETFCSIPSSYSYRELRLPSPRPAVCVKRCCVNPDKRDKEYLVNSRDTKRTSPSRKSLAIEISSMSGTQLRSVVTSQIRVQNLLRESIAQLSEYADKVLHEDFSARPLLKELGLIEHTIRKDICEKIKYFLTPGDNESKSESEPDLEPKGKVKIDGEDIMREFHKKPQKESNMELKKVSKMELKKESKVEFKKEPKVELKEESKMALKKELKSECKIQSTSKLKVEPNFHSSKEETEGRTMKEVRQDKCEPKCESKWESNEIIKKETNKLAKGESKEKATGESKAKIEKETASNKSLKQLDVENQIHIRVVTPMINRIQRSYLSNMEDQMRLMSFLESLPSALVDLLKDHSEEEANNQ